MAKAKAGRTKDGKIKKGYRLTAGGRLVKATGAKKKKTKKRARKK